MSCEVRILGSSLGGCPVVRQKLGNPGNGMLGDAGENVFEPDERIDSDALTGSHETPQHRGGLAAFITAVRLPNAWQDSYRYQLGPYRNRHGHNENLPELNGGLWPWW